MKAHPFQRFSRPRLEALEDRCCPSTLIVQEGETLFITGDNRANVVRVVEDRAGLHLFLDGHTRTFTGVEHLRMETRGGADVVSVTLTAPVTLLRSVQAATGGGGDEVSYIILGNKLSDSLILRQDTGGGDDVARVMIRDEEEFGGRIIVQTFTGSGNDTAVTSIRDSHDITGSFNCSMDMGTGDDHTLFEMVNVFRYGRDWSVNLNNGAGNDRCAVMIVDSDGGYGELNMNVLGDSGIDEIVMIVDYAPHPEPPPGHQSISVLCDGGLDGDILRGDFDLADRPNASLDVTFRGGEGDGADLIALALAGISNLDAGSFIIDAAKGVDDIRVIVGFNPQPDPPGTDVPVRDFTFWVDAGEDNDTVDFRVDQANRTDVRLSVTLLGSDGDDVIGLNAVGTGNPDTFIARLIGGAGYDIARLNVLVPMDQFEEVHFQR